MVFFFFNLSGVTELFVVNNLDFKRKKLKALFKLSPVP